MNNQPPAAMTFSSIKNLILDLAVKGSQFRADFNARNLLKVSQGLDFNSVLPRIFSISPKSILYRQFPQSLFCNVNFPKVYFVTSISPSLFCSVNFPKVCFVTSISPKSTLNCIFPQNDILLFVTFVIIFRSLFCYFCSLLGRQ